MSFDDVLFTRLKQYSGLTALIGDKVYPDDNAPQSAASPFVTFLQIHRNKNYTHSGYNGTSIYSMQLSAYAPTKDQAKQIADQIALAMENWPAASDGHVDYAFQEDEDTGWDDDLKLRYYDLYFDIFYHD